MADYGIQLNNGNAMSEIDSGYANYSVVREFKRNFQSKGVKTVDLGVRGNDLLIAVRHPGMDVGFLRFQAGNPAKVTIYIHQPGEINFIVYDPDQTLGETGWGMRITDPSGREVYHTDLSYLAVNDFNQFDTTLDGGYYILGSYRTLRFEFDEDFNSSIFGCVDIYRDELVSVCGFEFVRQPDGSLKYEFVCRNEWQEVYQFTRCSWFTLYKVFLQKFIGCVRHRTNDRVDKVERLFWEGEVYEDGASGTTISGAFPNNQPNPFAVIRTQLTATGYGQFFVENINPANFTSEPNKLLVSDSDFA